MVEIAFFHYRQTATRKRHRCPKSRIPLCLIAPPSMADSLQNSKSNISAYYQTRAAHHAVVTTDWLAQAQTAVGRHTRRKATGEPHRLVDEEEEARRLLVLSTSSLARGSSPIWRRPWRLFAPWRQLLGLARLPP